MARFIPIHAIRLGICCGIILGTALLATGCFSAETLAQRDALFGTFDQYMSRKISENFNLPVYYSRPVCDKRGCWVN